MIAPMICGKRTIGHKHQLQLYIFIEVLHRIPILYIIYMSYEYYQTYDNQFSSTPLGGARR